MFRRILLAILGVAILAGAAFLIRLRLAPRPENQEPGKFPEQLVFVRSKDDVVSGGALFTAPKESSQPIAVIWIHGWGVNFYYPDGKDSRRKGQPDPSPRHFAFAETGFRRLDSRRAFPQVPDGHAVPV